MEFFATEMDKIGGIIIILSLLFPLVISLFLLSIEDDEDNCTIHIFRALFTNFGTFAFYAVVWIAMKLFNASDSVIGWSLLIYSIIFALIQIWGLVTAIAGLISSRKHMECHNCGGSRKHQNYSKYNKKSRKYQTYKRGYRTYSTRNKYKGSHNYYNDNKHVRDSD